MPETLYQAVLFSGYDPPSHFFYVVTDFSSKKCGQAADVDKRMKDRQLKGRTLVGKIPCDCPLQRDSKGREYCQREIAWANAHRKLRLPASEWFQNEPDEWELRYLFGDNPRSLAVIDRMERNARRDVA